MINEYTENIITGDTVDMVFDQVTQNADISYKDINMLRVYREEANMNAKRDPKVRRDMIDYNMCLVRFGFL